MMINHLMKRTLGLLACVLMLISTAMAQTTFFATQQNAARQSILYRFTATSSVSTFLLTNGLSGMTTVPSGVSVGNMNGGARGGDVIGFTGIGIYRLDDAFGTNPNLVQIGVTNTLPASPVFVGNRLFSIGGALPLGVYITEVDPVTFTEISREPTGIFQGSGGMFHVSGLTFRYVVQLTDRLYEYTLGSGNTSTNLGATASHDYAGLEKYDGTVYATFALSQTSSQAKRFSFGTIDPNTGAYTQLRDLDSYQEGITALTVATPNHAPVANAGTDMLVSCCSSATLNGSASSDPDGDMLTYEWYEGTTLLSNAVSPTLALSAGIHNLTLTITDPSGASSSDTVQVTVEAFGFDGFLSPINGADATGGSYASPLLTHKQGSAIPVKFRGSCCGNDVLSGVHTLQAIKYTSATASNPPINATSTDAATTGNQFRLTGSQWHFNLDTGFLSKGTWKLVATLSDGSTHFVWVTLK
ncbi:PKD domain-containing protein [Armatimonas sp.]|uniref:PKD domain-containing protein n=1 Tax=Armatimonas sp. TaxID=1872638 RepID=UPI003751C7A7